MEMAPAMFTDGALSKDIVDIDYGNEKEIGINLEKMLNDAMSPQNAIAPDLKIDDRDIKQAPNFYRFSMSPKGLNQAPLAKQLVIFTHLLNEWCPICTSKSFVFKGVKSSFHTIKDFPVDFPVAEAPEHVTFLNKGVCPKCKRTKSQMIKENILPDPSQLIMNIGQRSGKSIGLSLLQEYLCHRQLKLQNPVKVYGETINTTLTATMVALTYDRAKRLLLNPFIDGMKLSPWFQEYFQLLRHYEEQYSEEIMIFGKELIQFKHRNLVIHASGPSKRTLRGDCLVGNTMVNTTEGFVEFNELGFAKGIVKTKGLKIDTPYGQKSVSHTYKTKRDTTINFRTRNGFELEGTPEHPVLTLTPKLTHEWKRLDELSIGDWVVGTTQSNKPIFGTNNTVNKDMATIIGTFVANGSRNEISSDDPLVVDRFYKAIKRITGKTPSVQPGEPGVRADTHYVHGSGVNIPVELRYNFMAVLAQYGYESVKSKDKQIPYTIRTAPKAILHEYLEAYFACDCGINGGSTRNSKNNTGVEIEVSSASFKMLKQLQIILAQVYSIIGRRQKRTMTKRMDKLKRVKKDYTIWVLHITGSDAFKFSQTFKRAKIQKYAERIKDIPAGFQNDRRVVPYFRQFMYELWEKHRVESKTGNKSKSIWFEDGTTAPNSIVPWALQGRGITKQADGTLKFAPLGEFMVYPDNWDKVLPVIKNMDEKAYNVVKDFLEFGAHYEQITVLKSKANPKQVYDFTVPDGHAFTANGLSSHNTRIWTSTDEVGLFPLGEENSDRERANGPEVYESLDNSLGTLREDYDRLIERGFNNVPNAYGLYASSPFANNDMIMSLTRQLEGSPGATVAHLATWEMNPKMRRDGKFMMQKYRQNAEKAERDFGANPPLSDSPYISRDDIISYLNLFKKDKYNLLKDYKYVTTSHGSGTRRYAKFTKMPSFSKPSMLAIDAGYSNNSFALVLGTVDDRDRPIVPGFIEIAPTRGKPLDYALIYDEIIIPIIEHCNVQRVYIDRWQSLKIRHDIERDTSKKGIEKMVEAIQYSLVRSDFDTVIDYMNDKDYAPILPKVECTYTDIMSKNDAADANYPHTFKNQPVAHFVFQMATVRETSRTIDKGSGYTDDLFRAYILLMSYLYDQETIDWLKLRNSNEVKSKALFAGSLMGAGGYSGNTTSSGVGAMGSIGGLRMR